MSDPFEDFDVDTAEKPFLLELLLSGNAPPEEITFLKQVSCETRYQYMSPRERIQQFTANLLRRTGPDLGAMKLDEFNNEVYHYSRAVGLGPNQAKVESMMAEAEWKSEKQLIDGFEFLPNLHEMQGKPPMDCVVDDMEHQLSIPFGVLGNDGMLGPRSKGQYHQKEIATEENNRTYSVSESRAIEDVPAKQVKAKKARGLTKSIYFDKRREATMDYPPSSLTSQSASYYRTMEENDVSRTWPDIDRRLTDRDPNLRGADILQDPFSYNSRPDHKPSIQKTLKPKTRSSVPEWATESPIQYSKVFHS